MNEATRCQFELIETAGDRFRYQCARCGLKTGFTSHTADRVFCECRKAIGQGYWENMDCIHRGDVVRQIECQLCGQKGKIVDVHYCSIHGECTIKRATYKMKPKVCLGCTSHVHP